jgi:hypothetical protein
LTALLLVSARPKLVAGDVGAKCHLGLHANRVTPVHGRIQAIPLVSGSGSALVDVVGEPVADNGSTIDEVTIRIVRGSLLSRRGTRTQHLAALID